MKNRSIEAKVGYGSAAGAIVTGFFGTLAWLAPHVHQPPAYLVALYVTVVSLVAGYLAPHTSRPKLLTPAESAALDKALATAAYVSPVTSTVPGAKIVYPGQNVATGAVDPPAPPAQPPAGNAP